MPRLKLFANTLLALLTAVPLLAQAAEPKPAPEFGLQLNWPDVNNTPPGQFLEDANLDFDVSGRMKLRVRLGQLSRRLLFVQTQISF
jgi:hypothetical protein